MTLAKNILKKDLNWTLFAIVLFVIAMIFFLPMMDKANGELETPDSDFWYDAKRLSEIRLSYDDEQAKNYVETRWTYDVVWPIVYGFFMFSTIRYMTQSLKKRNIVSILRVLPFVAVFFDFIENTMCSLFFLDISSSLTGRIAPLASGLKWSSIFLVFIVQGGLLLMHIVLWIKRKVS